MIAMKVLWLLVIAFFAGYGASLIADLGVRPTVTGFRAYCVFAAGVALTVVALLSLAVAGLIALDAVAP